MAVLLPKPRSLRVARLDLRELEASCDSFSTAKADAITSLRAMLVDQAPELRHATVLIDSPRWPSDLDWSQPGVVPRGDLRPGRQIDAGLRGLVSALRDNAHPTLAPLSMFPTPSMRYFGAHLNATSCKPSLRSLGQALFGEVVKRDFGPPTGGKFTRFMIAGFATYRALQPVAGEVYECYPDLQFRLWCGERQLPSKNGGGARALGSRLGVIMLLARKAGLGVLPEIRSLDQADATIMALSAFTATLHGATLVVQNVHEGSFMMALDESEARCLQEHQPVVLGSS